MASSEVQTQTNVIDSGPSWDSWESVGDVLEYMAPAEELSYSEANVSSDMYVFWSKKKAGDDVSSSQQPLKDDIIFALQQIPGYQMYLVQFWAPVTIGGRRFLTTSHQPFALKYPYEGLCRYRKKSVGYNYSIDDDGDNYGGGGRRDQVSEEEEQVHHHHSLLDGPPARVFRSKFLEFSPDIKYYTPKEFPLPLRDSALGSYGYLAVPVFQSLSPHHHRLVGVLEVLGAPSSPFVSPSYDVHRRILKNLKTVNLTSTEAYCHLSNKENSKVVKDALDEIETVLKMVCRKHKLALASTWIPHFDKSCGAEVMSTIKKASFSYLLGLDTYIRLCHLRKGEGVVMKTYSSRQSCFCRDITMLNICDHPLAKVANDFLLSSSFALCLQSTLTGSDIYVLELFLPNEQKDNSEPWSFLESLIETMKKHFQTFKIAYGQELGDELLVDVKKVSKDDRLDSFSIFQGKKSLGSNIGGLPEAREPMHTHQACLQIDPLIEGNYNTFDIGQNSMMLSTNLEHSQGGDPLMQLNACHQQSSEAINNEIELGSVTEDQSNNFVSRHTEEEEENFCIDESCSASNHSGEGGSWKTVTAEELDAIVQLSACHQQSSEGVNNEIELGSVIVEESNNVVSSHTEDEEENVRVDDSCIVINHSGEEGSGKKLTGEELEQYCEMKLVEVAAKYGDSRSTFKRKLRKIGIPDWSKFREERANPSLSANKPVEGPPSKRKKAVEGPDERSSIESNGRNSVLLPVPSPQGGRVSVAQDVMLMPQATSEGTENGITINVKHGTYTIKFKFSLSLGIKELQEQVKKRLNDVDFQSYDIKYRDEDGEDILVACDEDLQECAESFTKLQEKTKVVLFVERKPSGSMH